MDTGKDGRDTRPDGASLDSTAEGAGACKTNRLENADGVPQSAIQTLTNKGSATFLRPHSNIHRNELIPFLIDK